MNKCDKRSISFLLLKAEGCDRAISKLTAIYITERDQCPDLSKETFFLILFLEIYFKKIIKTHQKISFIIITKTSDSTT